MCTDGVWPSIGIANLALSSSLDSITNTEGLMYTHKHKIGYWSMTFDLSSKQEALFFTSQKVYIHLSSVSVQYFVLFFIIKINFPCLVVQHIIICYKWILLLVTIFFEWLHHHFVWYCRYLKWLRMYLMVRGWAYIAILH